MKSPAIIALTALAVFGTAGAALAVNSGTLSFVPSSTTVNGSDALVPSVSPTATHSPEPSETAEPTPEPSESHSTTESHSSETEPEPSESHSTAPTPRPTHNEGGDDGGTGSHDSDD